MMWRLLQFLLLVTGFEFFMGAHLSRRSVEERTLEERLQHAKKILSEVPLIDGHNDLAGSLRRHVENRVMEFPFDKKVSEIETFVSMTNRTDLVKIRAGHLGGQFWLAFVPCHTQYKNPVTMTLQQIDALLRLFEKYPNDMQLVTKANGAEGGHSIDSSLAVLRAFYKEGVSYISLSHSCNTPWADNSWAERGEAGQQLESDGLSPWGEMVIKEMNRLGMLVDLSHTAYQTSGDALLVSRTPVIFSHSNARALCSHTRNVPDDILQNMTQNGGIVMVAFVKKYESCSASANMQHIVDHINHIQEVAGVDHVGIRSDFNGTPYILDGLEDTSKYPFLFAELLKDPKWSDDDLKKLEGLNLIRTFKKPEEIRDQLASEQPWDLWIPEQDIEKRKACTAAWY